MHIRLVIAGSRTVDPTDDEITAAVLDALAAWGVQISSNPAWLISDVVGEVVCGEADGGDSAGKRWAMAMGIPVHPEPITPADRARWGKYLAPKARNARMADRGTHAICFWDRASNGTTDLHARMGLRGKPSRIVEAERRRSPQRRPRRTER